MESYPLYLAGSWVETSDKLEVRNSYSREVIASVSLAGNHELEKAIEAGINAEEELAEMPAYRRYSLLMNIAHGLEADRERIGRILGAEACKPLKPALAEVDRAIQTFIVAAEEARRLPAELMSIDWTPAGAGKEGILKYFPLGLVAGISPFNFPLNLAVHKIAPAIAAGCPIVLKPSSSTPLSTLELARIMDSAGTPPGALSVLPASRETGNRMVTDPRFKLLTFTGSPEVGWKMKSDAGKKRVVLELGGNAGVIVTPSASLSEAVTKCVVGGFAYAGQVCIHTQRILIHRSIFDSFCQQFVEKVKSLKEGPAGDPDTDISALINETNAIRVESWVNEAVASGATLLCGGKRRGAFYEPTVLTHTRPEMNVCCCEIFGPVVVAEIYDDFEEAVKAVDSGRYGLQAGVFTDSISEMNFAFRKIKVGGLMINEVPTFRTDHMPYGGVKDSGFGREGVKYAILDMLEPRLLVKPF